MYKGDFNYRMNAVYKPRAHWVMTRILVPLVLGICVLGVYKVKQAANSPLYSEEVFLRPSDDLIDGIEYQFAITPGDTLVIWGPKVKLVYHMVDSFITIDEADRVKAWSGAELANTLRLAIYPMYPEKKRIVR